MSEPQQPGVWNPKSTVRFGDPLELFASPSDRHSGSPVQESVASTQKLESSQPLLPEAIEPTSKILHPDVVARMGKTILKLTEPLVGDAASQSELVSVPEPARDSQPQVSERVLEAMHRLVEIIAQLRSPAGGWPDDVDPTPENLTPYVLEEAHDVLDALQGARSQGSSVAGEIRIRTDNQEYSIPASVSESVSCGQESSYILVDDLIPRLLWYIVRSSYDIMRLIGGIRARVFQAGLGWRTGMVRLVTSLATTIGDCPTAPDNQWFVDLATNQPSIGTNADGLLSAPDTLVQSDEVNVCQQPTWVENLALQLRQQIQAATPELALFVEPRRVEWLEPGSNWLAGFIQLTLDFEFVPELEGDATNALCETAPFPPSLTENSEVKTSPEDSGLFLPSAAITIRLSRSAFLRQELVGVASQVQEIYHRRDEQVSESSDPTNPLSGFIPKLVAAASKVVEALQNLEEGNIADGRSPAMLMDESIHRLLWQIVRTSYSVMQVSSGIRANVLQPEYDWQTGTLRLVAIFHVKTPNIDCYIDLATGQSPQASTHLLPKDAIIQSDESDLCRQPVLVENLLTTSIGQVRETAQSVVESRAIPHTGRASLEASLLSMDGTCVDLLEPNKNWESGIARLILDLEFMPDFQEEWNPSEE